MKEIIISCGTRKQRTRMHLTRETSRPRVTSQAYLNFYVFHRKQPTEHHAGQNTTMGNGGLWHRLFLCVHSCSVSVCHSPISPFAQRSSAGSVHTYWRKCWVSRSRGDSEQTASCQDSSTNAKVCVISVCHGNPKYPAQPQEAGREFQRGDFNRILRFRRRSARKQGARHFRQRNQAAQALRA